MSDLVREVERVRGATNVEWSDERAARLERAMGRRAKQRAMRRRVASAAGAAVVLAAIALGVTRYHPPAQVASTTPTATASVPTSPLPSGATVASESPDFALDRTPEGLSMRGKGAFVVGDAALVVRCGEVTVTGERGAFEIERTGPGARVTVTRGHVIVAWSLDSASLGPGESGVFPPAPAHDEDEHVAPPTKPQAQAAWRTLALAGSYGPAYDELAKAGPSSVRDEPGDLFLASDVARLSKHAAEAEAPLEKLIASFASDPRAPLAAFTLGRVRLEQLGHPREAAEAFAKARSLAPNGPLVEDAMARQIEALSRAGDTSAAHALALEYLQSYPTGRRTLAVKKFGGVE
ncbi:MAG TPA: hypothetical protein VH054_07575 [Polyangiaceae bacterium]|jgi:transmembrane sensor|nr:hypothetical protein [Polyangiaceae bacterium]